ncbi:HalOD1 output domain-containing protein [Salinibaculum salinum]|uniref:HalOD1 output domain-containing protein n=1 Tax=Salinibaculum salinum TaxID=3131996 RepID=UPI0030ECECA9
MSYTRTGFELGPRSYHDESSSYRFEYDQKETPASMAVVSALAEVMDADPTTLEPLQKTVDTDALDAFIQTQTPAISDSNVTLSLENYTVTVHSYGVVAVSPAEPDHIASA